MKTTSLYCAVAIAVSSAMAIAQETGTITQPSDYDTIGIDSSLGGLRGNSECLADLHLAFAVSGLVAGIDVKEGDAVAASDVLASLDQGAETLEVQRRLAIWQNRAELDAGKIKAEVSRQQFDAAKNLQTAGGAISAEEVQNRKMAADLAAAEMQGLAAQETVQELDYKTAQDALAKRTMTAPSAGIVSEIIKKKGESVQAYEPVIRLCDMSKIIFVANLPDSLGVQLSQGDSVPVQFGNQPAPISATVTFVSPVVDAASGLRKFKFDLPSGLAWLRPGMTAELMLLP
jgi:RND family efflux transporter MFP subunit